MRPMPAKDSGKSRSTGLRIPLDLMERLDAASPEQEQALIEQLARETPGARDWLTIAVLCGLRQAEQFTRRKSDVDTHLWAFVIPNAKHADQPKIAYIPPSAREAVQRQFATPGPWLIPNPHNPTEPFPIKLLSGASTKTVAQAGGWSSERMVADVYGHLTNQFVIEAMERAATGFGTATKQGTPKHAKRKSLK